MRAAAEMRTASTAGNERRPHEYARENHQHGEAADLSRRSFLVGTAAAGLALGYSAVPGLLGADQAFAARRQFRSQRLVLDRARRHRHGDLRQGRHGPAHRLHHGADRFRRARLELEGHAGPARLQRSEVQRPRARRADHRRQLDDDDELRCDEPRRCRGAYRVDGSGRSLDGRAGRRTGGPRLRDLASEVEEVDDVCRHRQERQGDQDLHAGRAQGDQAQDARSVHHDRRLGAAARHPLEDQRHGQIRHRRHAAGHGLRQGRDAAGALRRHGEIGRRQRGQEGAGLHQGRHARRQDRHHDRLGGGGGQHLCQRPQGGGCAEDQL